MSDVVVLSKENVVAILTALSQELKKLISEKDISLPYTENFNILKSLKTDGEGNMFLENNGEYFKIDNDSISNTKEKLENIYDVLNINEEEGTYSIGLPEDILTKIELLQTDGDGTKVLSNSGEYIDLAQEITDMSSEEIQEMLNNL